MDTAWGEDPPSSKGVVPYKDGPLFRGAAQGSRRLVPLGAESSLVR